MTDPLAPELRRLLRQQRSPQGRLEPAQRLHVMHRLLDSIAEAQRYEAGPDTAHLLRLAAHAIRWAEEARARENPDPIPGQLELR